MNTNNPYDTSLLPSEDQWAGEMAASLRLLQTTGADEPVEQRQTLIEDQVRRGLQKVPAAQRTRYLERLTAQFPGGLTGSAPVTSSSVSASRIPTTPDEVGAMAGEAWARFSPEQRRLLRERLAAAGVIESSAPAEPADLSEAKKAFGLTPAENLMALRLGRLSLMETDFLVKIDQLAWGTWKQVAPQATLKKDPAFGDLKGQIRRYLRGDAEITDQMIAQQLDRTRQLAAALLGGLGAASKGFSKRYLTRFAPDAVKDIVKMEGGIPAFGAEGKFWRKYVELAGEINEQSIQNDLMEAVARLVEEMMKAKKPGGV